MTALKRGWLCSFHTESDPEGGEAGAFAGIIYVSSADHRVTKYRHDYHRFRISNKTRLIRRGRAVTVPRANMADLSITTRAAVGFIGLGGMGSGVDVVMLERLGNQ